jgi:hypothetical protein
LWITPVIGPTGLYARAQFAIMPRNRYGTTTPDREFCLRKQEKSDMRTITRTTLWMSGFMVMALVGCAPKMDKETLRQMKPERPAELDMLKPFVGEWKGQSEMHIAGMEEPITGTGTSKMTWALDGMTLVDHGTWESEDMGSMESMGAWTWDPRAKKFRMVFLDSWGGRGEGVSYYDAKKNLWRMRGKSHSAQGTTHGKGTMRFIDDDTMEWTWSESVMLGLVKVFEGKGTLTRQ